MTFPIELQPHSGDEFHALAVYNAERRRGIVHTAEWDALMAGEQERFNQQQMDRWTAAGGHPLDPDDPSGPWMVPGAPLPWWSDWWWRIADKLYWLRRGGSHRT